MKLYSYWRSTTSVRVRAVLNLKKFEYEIVPVNLAHGDQHEHPFRVLNPSQGVPVLVLSDGTNLSQSHAIIEYLDRLRPEIPLLREEPGMRARELAAAYAIAMDIHPVNNLRVLNHLRHQMDQPEAAVAEFVKHWMHQGLGAFQEMINSDTQFAFGDRVGLADIYLCSQLVNARRWGLDLSPFTRLQEIDARTTAVPEVFSAMPDNQPDAVIQTETQ